MTTIIYAHPYSGSFNHAILENVTAALKEENKEATVIDLYADGFSPALEAASLRLYSRGETADPLVRNYIDILLQTDTLIMIYPIWWGMMPAIVKGFFDKVMLAGSAYQYSDAGNLVPAKINIKRVLTITTSQGPKESFAPFFEKYLTESIFSAVGFHNPEWYDCTHTSHGPEENRTTFLELVRKAVKG